MVELKETRRLYAMKVIKKELVTDDEVWILSITKFIGCKIDLIIIAEKCKQMQNLLFIKGYWLGANRETCIWNSI